MREAIMTRTATLLLLIVCCLARGSLVGQGLDPALLTKPATDAWPTYAGDGRAGRAYSLALLVEVARGHAHRQSWHRDVRRLAVLRDAGRLSRFARREDGPGALAQRDRGLQPAILLDDGTTSGRRSCAGGDG